MERFILLIPWLTQTQILNAHVTTVHMIKLFLIITCGTINLYWYFPYDMRKISFLNIGALIVTSWDFEC